MRFGAAAGYNRRHALTAGCLITGWARSGVGRGRGIATGAMGVVSDKTRPFSITRTAVQLCRRLDRCVMRITVRPCISRPIASTIAASASLSTALVGSSRMSTGRVVEPREQAHQGALARAGRAHDTEASAGFDGERDVIEDGTAWAVRERHMMKSDGAARARHGSCLLSLFDIQWLVEERERPFRAGEVKLERGGLPADRPEWLVELVQVSHHQEQLAQGECAGEDVTDADEQYRRGANSRRHSHDEPVAPLESGEAQRRAHGLSRPVHETLVLATFLSECFDD